MLSTEETLSTCEDEIKRVVAYRFGDQIPWRNNMSKTLGVYSEDNCGITYATVQFQANNNKKFGEYADDFAPTEIAETKGAMAKGCKVGSDFTKQLVNQKEALLTATLQYRKDGTCRKLPSPPSPPSANRAITLINPLLIYRRSNDSELAAPDELFRKDRRILRSKD